MNISEVRPDPDLLLSRLKQEEVKNKKGKLKIFFGMCAGVGKTFSMLQAAQKARLDNVDVVVGIVETHNRIETEELLKGLEVVPLKEINYRQSFFKEFDIDGVLTRNPSLVLIDELAHSNIPGSRHVKRYQDVIELLNIGIDVYTTLNVQHIESRSETVKQITGSQIRETIPDNIFEQADAIELVDITPEELLRRLSEGKVYTPESSKQAINNFFRKGNLTALREMALRITAERVNKDLRDYKNQKNIYYTWKAGQRLMCAIGPGPYSANLIRWTKRLASTMEATWIAVHIETDKKITEKNKETLESNFRLVEELGGELITTQDIDITSALIRIARENNITQLVVGKSRKTKLYSFTLRKDSISNILEKSGDIDVYVVGGEKNESGSLIDDFIYASRSSWQRYFSAFIVVALTGIGAYILQPHTGYQIVSLIFLLVLSILPLFSFGTGPMLLAALLSALTWNFFFIPPRFTFHIYSAEDVLMFTMYFIVASVNGLLSSKIRTQQLFLQEREERTVALYNLTKDLSTANAIDDIAEFSINNLATTFGVQAAIFFAESSDKIKAHPHSLSEFFPKDTEWNIAQWCFANNKIAGRFTNTLPHAQATYYPMKSKSAMHGVIGLKNNSNQGLSFEQKSFLETFIAQITNALEREYLSEFAKQSLVASESEKLYKTLFNSLSHELKTPITTIISAATSFSNEFISDNKELRFNLSREISIAADRLNRLVENLLDMTRLESGRLKIKLEWNDITDLIDCIVKRFKSQLVGLEIKSNIRVDTNPFRFDFALIEQALSNILHNCITYSGENVKIFIDVIQQGSNCIIEIKDNGPGFPPDAVNKLFNKFYRVPGSKTGGTGLGLSIAKGFIEAHHGSISAVNGKDGGAVFTIKIPIIQ